MTQPAKRPRDPTRVRRDRRILVAALGAVVLLAAAFGWLMWRTVTTQDEAAIAAMSATDREWLAKVERIRPGMTFEDVVDLLGEPDEEDPFGLQPRWYVAGAQWNQIRVGFREGGAMRIRWLKFGSFVYEKRLR